MTMQGARTMLRKIISGGQTGADRAGLDVAIRYGLAHGGAIPKGRRTEDGVLPDNYNLIELETPSYPARTEQNVIDSGATIIVSHGPLTSGSLLTKNKALQHNKPLLFLDMNNESTESATALLAEFLRHNKVEVLNVAGPRASNDPNIYETTWKILESVLVGVVNSVSGK